LSNSNNANASSPRDSENNNANTNEKTETKTLPPKPGPRSLLNANKNKPAEPLVNTVMQNNNGISKNASASGLHQSNQNGNDVIRISSPDKHVSTSLKSEESESKPHFASVSLKPVPLVVSTSVSSSSAGNAGIAKGSQISTSTAVQEREALKENRNITSNNASKPSSKPAPGNPVPSTMTDPTANGSSPNPRSSPTATSTDEPLPFLQAKSKLKRQQHLNSNVREEILNSNNNALVSSTVVRNDKNANANVEVSNSQSKPKSTIEFNKPKVREPEAEPKKIVNAPAQVEEIPPPLPSSPIPRAKLVTESYQTQPPSQPRKTAAARGNDSNDGIMVFNFTKTRNKVPDYLEDEGLGFDDTDTSYIDPKLIHFVGANIIINGKSSIQKRPKSKKVSNVIVIT
jgi:hypothetical protein